MITLKCLEYLKNIVFPSKPSIYVHFNKSYISLDFCQVMTPKWSLWFLTYWSSLKLFSDYVGLCTCDRRPKCLKYLRSTNSNRFVVPRIKTKTGSRAFFPSPSAARLPVDEPALASIMTHDHAKDLCASELGPLRI